MVSRVDTFVLWEDGILRSRYKNKHEQNKTKHRVNMRADILEPPALFIYDKHQPSRGHIWLNPKTSGLCLRTKNEEWFYTFKAAW